MTRRLLGAAASLLALLAGLWLVLSPFALGFQPEDADWTDGTLTDVWTGLPLALVGLIGVIVFAVSLRMHMIQAGYITPRPKPAAPEHSEQPTAAAERSREMDAMLEPLIAALARDIEHDHAAAPVPSTDTPPGAETGASAESRPAAPVAPATR